MSCEFVFDPEEWNENHPRVVNQGEFSCPRDSMEGVDRCYFHLSPAQRSRIADENDIEKKITNEILAGNASRRVFVGCDFGQVDLSGLAFHTPQPLGVYFLCCTFDSLNVSKCEFRGDLVLNGSKIGDFEVSRATFESDLRLQTAEIRNVCDLKRTEVRGDIDIRSTVFNADVRFRETKASRLVARPLSVDEDLDHNQVALGMAMDDTTEFNAGLRFFHTEFGTTDFRNVEFPSGVRFEFVDFYERVNFIGSQLGDARFLMCDFESLTFDPVCDGRVEMYRCEFKFTNFNITAPNPDIDFDLSLSDITPREVDPDEFFGAQADRYRELFSTAEEAPDTFGSEVTVHLGGSVIHEGGIDINSGDRVRYVLSDATVHDLSLNLKGAGNVFEYIHFNRTEFAGFDFTNYRDALSQRDWRFEFPSDESVTSQDREVTYLNAKNGATAIGDTIASSELLTREYRERRQKHAERIRGAGLTVASQNLFRWCINYILDKLSGYGEKPSRVVVLSIGIILLFGVSYTSVPGGVSGISASDGITSRLLTGLNISIASFTTLGFSASQPTSELVQYIASFEAFLGSFLLALLVFSLGKQVSR